MWQGNTEKDLYNAPANSRSPEALRVKIVHVRAGSRSGKTEEDCLMRTGFSPCSTWSWTCPYFSLFTPEWHPLLCEQPIVKSQTNNMLISEKLTFPVEG